jgi:hypothetical protein
VGQSLKTMLTRMEQVKLGQMFEDDTTTISQVAKSLHGVGIEIMLTADTFKPMGDVLDELGNKWGTLTQKQQNAIAGTVAGIRQVPQFLTLMQNWSEVTKALAIQTESAGLANERYAIYMQGVEAALNRSKAAWEGVWQVTVESGAIAWFYNLSAKIGSAIAQMGGLIPVVTTLVGVFVMLKAAAVTSFFAQLSGAFYSAVTGAKLLYTQLQGLVTGNTVLSTTTNALTVAQASQALAATAVTAAQAKLALAESGVVVATNALTAAQGAQIPSTIAVGIAETNLALAQGEVFVATNALTVAQQKLIVANAAVAASSRATWVAITGGLSLVITAIMAVVLAYNFFGKTAKETLDEINAKIDEHKSKFDSLSGSATSLKDLGKRYDELKNNYKETNEKTQEFIDLNNEIHRLLPTISGDYDELGNFILTAGVNQKTFNDEIQRQIDLERIQLQQDIVAGIDAEITSLEELIEARKKAHATVTSREKDIADVSAKYPEGNLKDTTLLKMNQELSDANLLLSESNSKVTLSLAEMRAEYLALLPAERELYKLKLATADISPAIIYAITSESAVLDAAAARWLANQQAVAGLVDQQKGLGVTLNELISSFQILQDAMDEQSETGKLSILTIMKLIDAGYAEILQTNTQTGALEINWQALRMVAMEKAQQAQDTAYLAYCKSVTTGTDAETAALLRTWQALMMVNEALKNAPTIPLLFSGFLGGSSSGSGITAEEAYQKVIEETIDLIKKEKQAEIDALEAKLEAFKKVIDARKEALRLAKEDADFQAELLSKNKSLADIKAQIAVLSLDNSEEAISKRLDLEAEAAKQEEDIYKFKEDRKYDLQIEALDKAYTTYEAYIEKKIAAIETYLADTVQLMADALARMVANAIETAARIAAIMAASSGGGGSTTTPPPPPPPPPTGGGVTWYGNGGQGLPRLHEGVDAGFVGNLKSNEEFAKLMDGELVINPVQMNNFMDKTLPAITSSNTQGDFNLSIPINVEGNLDKTVLPDLEKLMNQTFEKMNATLFSRGYKRAVDQVL